MGQPRRIVPGTKYFITRRCYQRVFRLRPSRETTAVIKYCLALALAKTGVRLHAVCVMSNHHHLVVTDERGTLPDFLRELHRAIAKALNALHGQTENLWAAEPCSALVLESAEDVMEKIAYVAANPVAAGLVEAPEQWPGLMAWSERVEHVARPNAYFSHEGASPAFSRLRIERPSFSGDTSRPSSWLKTVRATVRATVLNARHAVRVRGGEFLGRAKVLAQSVTARPTSQEPRIARVPLVSVRDAARRSVAFAVVRAFRRAYALARERWCGGERDVIFPSGTWWMRVHHRARTEPATHVLHAVAG